MSTSHHHRDHNSNRRTLHLAGKCALTTTIASVLCSFIAFVTNYWVVADRRFYGARFDKHGLWSHCFRSLPDPLDLRVETFFVGCRWIYDPFTTGYDEIRHILVPPFLAAVQTFFTLHLFFLLVAAIISAMIILCVHQHKQPKYIKVMIISLVISAFCGFIACIVFGIKGDDQNFGVNFNRNYLGWSFVLAVLGTIGSGIAAGLYGVEWKIIGRKTPARPHQQTKV